MKVEAIQTHSPATVAMEGASEVKMRTLIGPDDGAKKFHMRHFEVVPGGHTPHHHHDYEHEIFVLRGNGIARSQGGDRPIRSGDAVFVPPNEQHQFFNNDDETLAFLCLIPAPHVCAR